ncbi:post-transcriptional regulator [Bacillus paramycoides]|uniref:post-transcriptional regulator n=1 Tax=Bacillus paramycoides TaxID=2026194 RepID=UPI000BF394C7|nr:post-transcriptional regulator [Bacillus paramycoides]MBE5104397.1 post-transcriptional regulator [Bacillus thuringiensis]PFD45589.1 histidine kinase [Bacillus cereus]
MLEKEDLVESYRGQLQVVLESKVEEFQMFGYDRVTDNDIWKFLKVKKWKKIDSDVRLYELVNDVLRVTANEYMTYLTVEAYQAPLWSFDEYENK